VLRLDSAWGGKNRESVRPARRIRLGEDRLGNWSGRAYQVNSLPFRTVRFYPPLIASRSCLIFVALGGVVKGRSLRGRKEPCLKMQMPYRTLLSFSCSFSFLKKNHAQDWPPTPADALEEILEVFVSWQSFAPHAIQSMTLEQLAYVPARDSTESTTKGVAAWFKH
jgi:hypothetical protein